CIYVAGVFERLDHLRYRGALLADGDVNTNNIAALLVDDGIDGDGSFARLAVANDQLALSAADRNHGVDGFDSGLQRFFHRQTLDHDGREALDRVEAVWVVRAFALDGFVARVHYASGRLTGHRS